MLTPPVTFVDLELETAARLNTTTAWYALPSAQGTQTGAAATGADTAQTLTTTSLRDLTVAATTQLTVASPGYYALWGFIPATGASSAGTYRRLLWRKNGTTTLASMRLPAAASIPLVVSWQGKLVATDYVELLYGQDSGGSDTAPGSFSAVFLTGP